MIDIRNIDGEVILSTPINSGSKRKKSLMKEDYITLKFSLADPIAFNLGDGIDNELGKFELVDSYKPTYNKNTGGYDYELRLDAYYYKWKNKIFKFTPEQGGQEAAWNLTATLDTHLSVFLRNLKALGYSYNDVDFTFSIDSSVENSAKLVSYNNTNMIDALTMLAEAWECEWWVEDNVINFGRCEFGTPVAFEIGKNVEEMTSSASKTTYATRIYAFGSTRNIPRNYRPTDSNTTINGVVQKRLMLPEGVPYIDAEEGLSTEQAVEQVVVFEGVYPKTDFEISEVTTYDSSVKDEETGETITETFYRFKSSSKFYFSKDYILEDEELRIVFQSGSLNGMDFGVIFNPEDKPDKLSDGSLNPEAQLWEIVASEDYGRKLPDSTLKPQVGDKYILYGWDSTKIADLGLVSDAEEELLEEAKKHVEKSKIDPNTYNCKMMSDYMYGLDEEGNLDNKNTKHFEIGDKVTLVNDVYFKNGSRESRIIGYEYNIDVPYDSPIFNVGEKAAFSKIGELESKVEQLIIGGVTYTGGNGSGVYVIGTNDTTKPTNRNVYSSLKALQSFLNKDKEDSTSYLQKFLGGVEVGEAFDSMSDAGKGAIISDDGRIQGDRIELRSSLTIGKQGYTEGFTGFGGKIDENANAELESLTLRRFLEVPELRFNRIEVKLGDKWNAAGAGVFERVEPDYDSNGDLLTTGTGWLKLEEGEYGAIAVGDICMGIFHSLNASENATQDYDDSKGIFQYAGFYTCYFTITEITGSDNKEFRYKMRDVSDSWKLTYHPSAAMTFVCYGSFTDESRQTSQYTTRTYTRLLVGQNTWEIRPENIAMQWGDLSNLAIHGINMQGYSAYLNNIYMTGVIKQFNSAGNEVKVANDRGEYVSGTHYDYYDRVSYEGGLWLCIAEDGTNTAPSKNDSAWLNQVPAAQSITTHSKWDSSKVPYPASTILKFADRVWISNKETSEAPFPLYTDPNGNYYTTPDGGYYIVSETQSADWNVLLDTSGLVDGEDGDSIEVRYSADGSNWHFPYQDGDKYMQQRIGSESAWSDIITFVGEDGENGADGKYTDYQFAVNDSLTVAPTTGWQETPPTVESGQYLWMRMRVVNPNDGTTTNWSVARIGGEEGTSVYKSTVFIRQNTQPDIPEGGSYASPIPATTGWSDGIPDGENILWASTRVFTHNGKSPQEEAWSEPRQMTDTADFDVEFSSEEKPNPPAGHPNTNAQWSNASDETTIWMATSRKKNGVWSDWEVSKIKGEKGDMGISITTHGQWKSGMSVPLMGVVTMGGSTYLAKVATNNPPMWCYTDPDGNYYLTPNGGYYLTGEVNTEEYDLLVQSGKDGADGKEYEWIYQVKATSDIPSTPTSVQQDDYVPTGWNDNPTGVSETLPYEFASFRTKKDGVWSAFSTPALWAKFGKDGIQGLQGLQGEKGEQGIPGENGKDGEDGKDGENGKDGATSYFHIKYADDANGTNMNETGGDYIGTYVDFTQQDSTDPDDYTWVKTKGAQGEKGDQGIPGTNGDNGQTSYLHIAYANSADGSEGFSVSDSTGKLYIGQYTDFEINDSTDYTKYKWTLIKGEDGKDGEDGEDGVGIKSVTVSYAKSTSNSIPSSGWGSTIPAVGEGEYLWTRTVTDYTDDSIQDTVSYTYSYQGKTGQAGTSVSVTSIQYQVGSSATTPPTGTWSDNVVDVPQGQYLWSKTTFSDGNVAYGVAKQGTDGKNGEDGVGIKSVTVSYAKSTSNSIPSSGWGSTIPAVGEGEYLWTRTVTDYTDDSIQDTISYTYSYQGKTGQAGTSVTVVSIKYQAGESGVTPPQSMWYENVVDVPQGWFLWSMTTFSDGKVAYGVAKQPKNGEDGEDGQSLEMMGNWYSGLTVPKLGIVLMGGRAYVAKVATTNPPLWCYTDSDGNRLTYNDGGYILTGEENSSEYDYMVGDGKDGQDGKDGKDGEQGPQGPQGEPGETGAQGIQGCVYRTTEWAAGVAYHNDTDVKSDTIRYIDIVSHTVEGVTSVYQCLVSHTSTSDNAPNKGTGQWQAMNEMQPIYTPLLFAENAVFRFGQGNQFLITDSEGVVNAGLSGSNEGGKIRFWAGSQTPDDAPFRVNNDGEAWLTNAHITGEVIATSGSFTGTVNAESGVFNDVDIESGTIGGFTIEEGTLRTTSVGSGRIIIEPDTNKFIRINNDASSPLFVARNDSSTIMQLDAYGTNATALEVMSSGGNGTAFRSTGNAYLTGRFSVTPQVSPHSLVTVAGLALSCKTGSSFEFGGDDSVLPSTAWTDFLVADGDITLPSAKTCKGKVLFVKTKGYVTCSVANGGIVTAAATTTTGQIDREYHAMIYISDGNHWYEFYCG